MHDLKKPGFWARGFEPGGFGGLRLVAWELGFGGLGGFQVPEKWLTNLKGCGVLGKGV